MPANRYGLCRTAHIVRNNRGIQRVGGQRNRHHQVGLREPVSPKVACMDHARHLFAARSLRHANVLGLRLQDQSVHGVALGGGKVTAIVGRQRDGMPLPGSRQRFAVCRERPANPVRIRRQEGRAQPVTQISKRIVIHVQHLFRAGQIGRGNHIDFALAGEVGGDLQNLHPAPRHQCHARELRLGSAHGPAFECDDLLTAYLDNVLCLGKSCRQNCKNHGNHCECANEKFHVSHPFLGIHPSRIIPESVSRGEAILRQLGTPRSSSEAGSTQTSRRTAC